MLENTCSIFGPVTITIGGKEYDFSNFYHGNETVSGMFGSVYKLEYIEVTSSIMYEDLEIPLKTNTVYIDFKGERYGGKNIEKVKRREIYLVRPQIHTFVKSVEECSSSIHPAEIVYRFILRQSFTTHGYTGWGQTPVNDKCENLS